MTGAPYWGRGGDIERLRQELGLPARVSEAPVSARELRRRDYHARQKARAERAAQGLPPRETDDGPVTVLPSAPDGEAALRRGYRAILTAALDAGTSPLLALSRAAVVTAHLGTVGASEPIRAEVAAKALAERHLRVPRAGVSPGSTRDTTAVAP